MSKKGPPPQKKDSESVHNRKVQRFKDAGDEAALAEYLEEESKKAHDALNIEYPHD